MGNKTLTYLLAFYKTVCQSASETFSSFFLIAIVASTIKKAIAGPDGLVYGLRRARFRVTPCE